MKTKGGKDFSIYGSERKNDSLLVYCWVDGHLQLYRFLNRSKKEAYQILRQEAREGRLD